VVAGEPGLLAMDPGGIDVLSADLERFRAALSRENRTFEAGADRSPHRQRIGTRTRTRFSTRPASRLLL